MAASRRGGAAAIGAGVLLVVAALAACTTSYDVGSTPRQQLCDVLESFRGLSDRPADLRLRPLLEAGASDPEDVPVELRAIALTYRTKGEAYDHLGRYRPAIEFAAALVELSVDGLIGPSTLSPRVERRASAVDAALEGGACT